MLQKTIKQAPTLPDAIDDGPPADHVTATMMPGADQAEADSPVASRPSYPHHSYYPYYPWPYQLRQLKHGCYLIRYTPALQIARFRFHYDGTMRVQRAGFSTMASGDLYLHQPYLPRPVGRPPFPEPSPGAGIPIFPRSRYRYYLRVTQILQNWTFGKSFTLGLEMWRYDRTGKDWTNEGAFTALMTWKTPPAGFPAGAQYLEGDVKNAWGSVKGRLTMGWVSPYLRKVTIEVDRYSQSEYPADNGGDVDWQAVYDQVGWQVNAYESDTHLAEPSGQSWSDGELHAKMLAKRDPANLDTEWRYHLLCVRRLDSTSRGIMYDAYATDSNNVPREGAALSSHWVIPTQAKWGTVQGMRFGSASAPYFRTAVHELGHAMGLRHNTADNGFMNTTGVIAGNPGVFPANVQWSFNAEDAKKLRHMPDAWVRPGEIPWAPSYSAPGAPDAEITDAHGLNLEVTPLLVSVPIGAPVRVGLELKNDNGEEAEVPSTLSLKSDFVTGTVIGPHGEPRSFRSLVRCIEEDERATLKPGGTMRHDMTLLRGFDGPLFPAPGAYTVCVNATWEVDGFPIRAMGSAAVMVTPPENAEHAAAALEVLSEPDALLTLALGGDHLTEGVAAIKAALDDPVLRPHFGVIEAKRLGNRFGSRAADLTRAFGCIDKDTVMSAAEIKKVAGLVQRTKKASRKSGKAKAVISVLGKKVGQVPADSAVIKTVKQL